MSEQLFAVYISPGKRSGSPQRLHHIDNLRIERSLQNFAYSCSCSCKPTNIDFEAGDKIEVFWDEEVQGRREDPIFCGYIDRITLSISGGPSASYSASIQARSYALDLIDSVDSREPISGQLEEVCKQVCSYYCVPFSNTSGKNLGQVTWACEQQSPFQILDDLAGARGAMLVTNGPGALELTRPKHDILNSSMVLSLSNCNVNYTQDVSECYSRYSSSMNATKYEERDSRIRKSRGLELANDSESIGLVRSRLKNEKNRRYGMSQQIDFTLKGWKSPDFKTHWYENSNVIVEIPELGIERRQFFVYGVTLSASKYGGYQTKLSCCNREAFDLQSTPAPTSSAKPQEREVTVVLSSLEKIRKERLAESKEKDAS